MWSYFLSWWFYTRFVLNIVSIEACLYASPISYMLIHYGVCQSYIWDFCKSIWDLPLVVVCFLLQHKSPYLCGGFFIIMAFSLRISNQSCKIVWIVNFSILLVSLWQGLSLWLSTVISFAHPFFSEGYMVYEVYA